VREGGRPGFAKPICVSGIGNGRDSSFGKYEHRDKRQSVSAGGSVSSTEGGEGGRSDADKADVVEILEILRDALPPTVANKAGRSQFFSEYR